MCKNGCKVTKSRVQYKINHIYFYCRDRVTIVPIMGRITINGTQCQFSCKHSIALAMWDVKGRSNLFRFAPAKNCAKGRSVAGRCQGERWHGVVGN